MTKAAFELSEKYDCPVIIRMTTRLSHSKSFCAVKDRVDVPIKEYVKNTSKNVMVPALAMKRRVEIERRFERLAEYTEENRVNYQGGSGKKGVIASGMAYNFAMEVFGSTVRYLKLGFTNPLPRGLIKSFCEELEEVYIIEETEPYIESAVLALGIAGLKIHGKDMFPRYGELTPDIIRKCALGKDLPQMKGEPEMVVPRPPALCAGCPHRGFFYTAAKKKNTVISGDIGCYTLAFAKPYDAMDWTVCMGSSISAGHGAQKVFNMKGEGKRVISVLGDSTFLHSGMTSLLEVVYNNSNTINVILDNRITGMTGHQQNPASGFNAKGEPASAVNFEALVKAIGIKNVVTVDPNDLSAVDKALDLAYALDEPSVIITRWPCVLKRITQAEKEEFENPFTKKARVDEDKCIKCKLCLKCGCPALSISEDSGKAVIDPAQCVGCGVCSQVCPKNAIEEVQK
jgi:indolepyruvate ferredoxin oxidoreductase alpha subunit